MLKRFFLVFLTLIMSIFAVFAAAEESPGDRVISFDEPMILLISLGIILCLFIPPFVMSFSSLVVRIISGVYQCFIVLTFAGLIPIGFLIPNGFLTILAAVLGTLVSSASVAVTLFVGRTENTNKLS